MKSESIEEPSFGYALMMLMTIVLVISVGILIFDVPIQLLMFLGMFILIPFMMKLGYSYHETNEVMLKSMAQSLSSVMILLGVGILIGTWIASGTVPTLIYYGINLISPNFFLVATLIFTSVVSLTTGTSWGSIGTAGVAMMGIGNAMSIPAGVTAGAIISGAFFGDKISPLSDTTNLTPTVTGGTLFGHIKHMLYPAVPAYIITAIIFMVIGLQYDVTGIDSTSIDVLINYLTTEFNIGFISLTPIILLIGMMLFKIPAVISILTSALYGGVLAIVYQGFSISETFNGMYEGYSVDSGIPVVNNLLQRGGLISMLPLIALFLFALGLGGMLSDAGVLEALIKPLESKINSPFSLTLLTMGVGYVTLAIGGAIYFSAVMTGTLMRPLYERMGLAPENLSRTIEATSTLSGPIFPWVGAGIFATQTLGVTVGEFLPYMFLAFLTPLFLIVYSLTGFSMTKLSDKPKTKKNTDVQEA